MPIIFWCRDFECYSVDGSTIFKDIATTVWMIHWDSLCKSMTVEVCVHVCVCGEGSEERQESDAVNIEHCTDHFKFSFCCSSHLGTNFILFCLLETF